MIFVTAFMSTRQSSGKRTIFLRVLSSEVFKMILSLVEQLFGLKIALSFVVKADHVAGFDNEEVLELEQQQFVERLANIVRPMEEQPIKHSIAP